MKADRGSKRALAVLPLLLALTTACLHEVGVCVKQVRAPGFTPRLRFDRAGLSDAQRLADPGYGPYRDGKTGGVVDGAELASELAPVLAGAEEKLLQSDCYWAAAGDDPAAPIDQLALSWEMVSRYPDDTPLLERGQSATRIGQCRLRDPIDGRPVIFCTPDTPGANPIYEDREDCRSGVTYDASVLTRLPVSLPEGCTALDMHDLELDRGDSLIDLERVRPRRDDGVCPAPVAPPPAPDDDWLLEAGLVEHRIGRFDGPVERLDERFGCSTRELLRAEGDGAYRLVIQGAWNEAVNWLGPNVFTIHGRRTVRRPMTRVAGTDLYAWQTEVDERAGTSGEPGARRWRENWSPRAVVEGVRIYREAADGTRAPAASDARVRILGDYGGAENPAWDCTEHTDEGDATYFPIHREDGAPDCDVRVEGREGTTPTYALEFLDLASGAIETPLRWEVDTDGVDHASDTVFLEFELRAVRGGASLTADPIHDFGRLATGRSGHGRVTIENPGENAVRLAAMTLGGPEAADFRFRALGEKVWLPLPIELVPDAADIDLLSLVPGFGSEPSLVAWSFLHGAPTVRLTADDHGGQTVTLYGAEVDFGTGRPVLVDPAAAFAIGPSHPDASLPFGRWAFRAAPMPAVVPAAGRLEVAVTATPSGYGPRHALLRVDYVQANDPSVSGSIATSLAAEGIAGPMLAVLPDTVAVVAGEARRVALESIGNLPLERAAIAVSGPDAGAFAIASDHPTTRTLAPGEVEVFAVRFAPAALPAFDQPASATLEIATDAGTAAVTLFGRSPLATRPALAFTPDQPVLPVHLHNLAGHAVERRTVSLGGPDRDRFVLLPTPDPTWTPIAPRSAALLFHVRYALPCAAPLPPGGRHRAELEVDTDAGAVDIALVGSVAPEDCP